MKNENVEVKPFTNKLCMSFFVSGDIYHSYIPFMLYSLFTAYPEHFVIISVKGKLSDDIKNQIRDLGHENNFCIKEDFGNDFPDNPDTWKTLRWVCVHPEYFLFDYVYVGDVDYIFTREDIPLLERKIKVMEMENLPYANTNKCDDPKLRGNRMTGIHFFSVAEYLPPMVETLKKYKDILYSCLPINFYNNKLGKFDNQMALRVMIEEAGLGMPKFNTFEYNGLHIGHSRCDGRWKWFLENDELHRNYMKYFMKNIYGSKFIELYENAHPKVKEEVLEIINIGKAWYKEDE